nr:uncharacterized protein LOC109175786 [Ipomoea batatas]
MANILKDGLEWLPLLAAISVYNSPRRMNSKKSSIYTVGKCSIPSTFLFHHSIRSNGSNEGVVINKKNPSEKCPKISLSTQQKIAQKFCSFQFSSGWLKGLGVDHFRET